MADMIVLLFISVALPLGFMTFAVRGRTRLVFIFVLCGLCACLLAAHFNTALMDLLGVSKFYMTVNVTPIVEELLKLLPLVVFALAAKPGQHALLESGIACGIGFAILENALIIARAADSVTLFSAAVRGIGAGMMHALCACMVALGISLFRQKRKWFFPGTAALIICAMTFHSLYNILIQSSYYVLGVIINIVFYAVLLAVEQRRKKKNITTELPEGCAEKE